MGAETRYRVIVHGPSSWKGVTRPVDAEMQTPFIVAFDPQNNMVAMHQGTMELRDLVVDDVTCSTQILSLFFFEKQDQAADAQGVLTKSLDRLQTLYDVFRSTGVLEVLEKAIGSVHLPLEVVARRIDLISDEHGCIKTNGNVPLASQAMGSYNIRLAVSQNLVPVTPEMDMMEYIKQAVGKKNHMVNRVSISFYPLPGNRTTTDVQIQGETGTPYVLRKSAMNTPRNVTRATTPSARAGKAIIDLYSKRGLINPPTHWSTTSYDENVIAAVSPVLKGAMTSHQLEQTIGELRSVSQEQYVAVEEFEKAEDLQREVNDTGNIAVETDPPDFANGIPQDGRFDFADVAPPSSDRTTSSGIANAVDIAIKLFDTWNFDDYEVVNMPEPIIQIPRSSSKKVSMPSEDERVKKLEEENKGLSESNDRHLSEISRLRVRMEEIEQNLKSELNSVKLQNEIETAKLNETLKEREDYINEIISATSSRESEALLQSNRVIDDLKQQLKAVVEERNSLSMQVKSITEEREKLFKEIEAFESRLSDVNSLEDSIKQLKVERDGQIAVMRDCIAKQQKEKERLNAELHKYKREHKRLTTELEEVKQVEQRLMDDVKRYENDLSRMDGKDKELMSSNSRVMQLKDEINQLKQSKEELKQLYAEAEVVRKELKHELDVAAGNIRKYEEELEVERNVSAQLRESLKDANTTLDVLEIELRKAKASEERLKSEKSDAVDKVLKEKLKNETLIRDNEMRNSSLASQVSELSIKLDASVHEYERIKDEYAVHYIKCCVDRNVLRNNLASSNRLRTKLVNTILRSKAELARKRWQLRLIAKTLQLDDDVTDRQIVSELVKRKGLQTVTRQNNTNHEKLKAAYNRLKAEKDELVLQMETKQSGCKTCARRNDNILEENKRLVSALTLERERLASIEIDAKQQIRNELTKSNEEKRVLYAKQCELRMENQDLKEEIAVLKRQVTVLQMGSIDNGHPNSKTSINSSTDGANLVVHKLSNMPNVFGNADVVRTPMKSRMSDTTFAGDMSIEYVPSIDFAKQRTLDRSVIPGSPCAYKDTKASLYSRRATLERIRARQVKESHPFNDLAVGNTIKHKHPWMF
ncbi:viral A-type inclusion protein, putative [Babesia ovis]|uniref:Viral A-type inclusion protein, putative n=1 Tax=Babesia ovis TaxID=5869 RepID=A0A9W5T8D6_BABOV|nr:viral A-type inclusion protein, putative [Babesia ovis]